MMRPVLALILSMAATPALAQHSHHDAEHPADPHAGHDMPQPPMQESESTPPPATADSGPRHAADSIWGATAMRSSRDRLAKDNGGMTTTALRVERLEARLGDHDAYLWDADGWTGGDLDKLWIKTEGEGAFEGPLESAEVQALWSHAIGPFFDLQGGIRYDIEPDSRAHLVVGLQGLAPYMFEVDAAAFLSDRGDLTARIEAEYDQRITQRLILQPRAELSLSTQDVPERDLGAGFTNFETGLRLRYEFAREFAPYVGLSWETRLGGTADRARDRGDSVSGASFLLGVRVWY